MKFALMKFALGENPLYIRMLLQKGFYSVVSQTMVTKMGNSFFSTFKFIVDSFLFIS